MGSLPYLFARVALNSKSGTEAVNDLGLDHKSSCTKYRADWESKYLEFSVSTEKVWSVFYWKLTAKDNQMSVDSKVPVYLYKCRSLLLQCRKIDIESQRQIPNSHNIELQRFCWKNFPEW